MMHNRAVFIYSPILFMALKLTPRQQQILDLIRLQIKKTGFPPTRAEIARELGFRSANAAEDHLKALAKKGALLLTAGASRGIRLLAEGDTESGHDRVPLQSAPRALSNDNTPGPSSGHKNVVFDHLVLPVIGRVAAGSPILATEHVDREINVEPALFTQTPDYLLTVRGLSMRDAGILDGDLLAVKKTTEARSGQIVVARLGDDVTVKRLQRQGQQILLLPENPDFDPIRVSESDNFILEGIAVGLIRTLQ